MSVPDTVFYTRVRDETKEPNPFRWQEVTSREIFSGKTVVVFGLPGAFTPTCSDAHLPGFEHDHDKLKSLGVDDVFCLAVNDAFVMFQWAKHLNVSKVKMLPDGNADFTARMGMLIDKHQLGFGYRSRRYSMLVKDGHIVKVFTEAKATANNPDPFRISDSQTMVRYLESRKKRP